MAALSFTRLALLAVLALATATSALATTIRVPADQPTIQAGIDAAGVGDTVLVASGSYTGAGNWNIDFGGRDIVLRSEEGRDLSIIDVDAGGNFRRGLVLTHGESPNARVGGIRRVHVRREPGRRTG